MDKDLIKKIIDRSTCYGTVFLDRGEYGFIFLKPNPNSFFFFLLDPNIKNQMSLTNCLENVIISVLNILCQKGFLNTKGKFNPNFYLEFGTWITKDSLDEFDKLSLTYIGDRVKLYIKKEALIHTNEKPSFEPNSLQIFYSNFDVKINKFTPFNLSENYLELVDLLG